MTMRCVFITSSYLRTFLRMTKFCSSTFFCAFSIWFERIFASIGWSSGILKRSMMFVDPVAGEQAHEVVLRRRGRSASRRVALAARAAAELVVDAARLVPLGAEHVEAAELDARPRRA